MYGNPGLERYKMEIDTVAEGIRENIKKLNKKQSRRRRNKSSGG